MYMYVHLWRYVYWGLYPGIRYDSVRAENYMTWFVAGGVEHAGGALLFRSSRCTSRNIPSRNFPGKLSLAEVFRLRPVISWKENTRFVPAKTFWANIMQAGLAVWAVTADNFHRREFSGITLESWIMQGAPAPGVGTAFNSLLIPYGVTLFTDETVFVWRFLRAQSTSHLHTYFVCIFKLIIQPASFWFLLKELLAIGFMVLWAFFFFLS